MNGTMFGVGKIYVGAMFGNTLTSLKLALFLAQNFLAGGHHVINDDQFWSHYLSWHKILGI